MWVRRRPEQIIGSHYRVTRELGIGATGTVLAAIDLRSGNRVAIKVLHPHLMKDAGSRRSLREELQLAMRVSSPSVVRVIEIGEGHDLAWIVMEHVGGGTLRRLLKYRHRVGETEALLAALGIAGALEAAHEAGVAHGDVKPENILIDEQRRARLTDFGLARIQTASGQTAVGTVGSIEYMAPESLNGRSDMRSDVYSFGVVLFEMLVGATPFHAADPWQVARNHREQVAPAVPAQAGSIKGELAKVIERCLHKAPDDRYQSGAELIAALREICGKYSINEDELRIRPLGLITVAVRSAGTTVPLAVAGTGKLFVGATAAALFLGVAATAAVMYWPTDGEGRGNILTTSGRTATRVSGVLGNAESPTPTKTLAPLSSPVANHTALASPTQHQEVLVAPSDSPIPAFVDTTTPTVPVSPAASETPTPTPSETATVPPSATSTRTRTPTLTPSPTPSNCPPAGSSVQGVGSWCGSLPGPIIAQTDFAVSLLLFGPTYGRTDLSADVSTPNRESSLVFRAQDDGNGYQLIYQPNGLAFRDYEVGGMWLYRRQDYQGEFLAYAPVTAGPGEPSRVRILAEGSSIRVWLDGVLVIDVTDSAIGSGHVGFRVVGGPRAPGDVNWPCDATFSNISIAGDPP